VRLDFFKSQGKLRFEKNPKISENHGFLTEGNILEKNHSVF
jgi:hypothetical protein